MLARFTALLFSIACLCPANQLISDDTDKLAREVHAALKSANPEYRNGGTFRFKEGRLVSINLMRCKGITDLSPLSGFDLSSVTAVVLYNAVNVVDLSPLAKCPLTSLNLERCNKIHNLSPLKGMPLQWFRMYACSKVKDLRPLEGMPLQHLDIGLNPLIEDLSPLKGMPLHDLRIDNCPQIADISVLKGMPLTFLTVFGCRKVQDWSVLSTLKLETLYFTPALFSDDEVQIVRKMKSLNKIGTSWKDYRKEHAPEAFWKRYDAGEFREDDS